MADEPKDASPIAGMLIECQSMLSRAANESASKSIIIEQNNAHIAELISANETNLAAAKADRDALEASKNAEIDGLNAKIRALNEQLDAPTQGGGASFVDPSAYASAPMARNEGEFVPQDEAHVS